MMQSTVKIYVELLDEGSPTLRQTQAIALGDALFKLLAPEGYDPQDEKWAFPPGSIVRGEKKINQNAEILFAVAA